MKKLLLMFTLAYVAIGAKAITVTDTIFNRTQHETFAFGADVSFVPSMEGWGTKWQDKNGKQNDILQILKEQGINSIRLRVWTVSSGSSSKQEVVNMCTRAKAKGMNVMIDFHYSDTWADPGSQTIPAAWTDHSVDALAKNIYDHTFDVLSAIKRAGVVPKWVQVGNETKRGMLYPVGQTNKGGAEAFARFVLSGYNAVKAVDSTMQVIVHLPDGHDNSLYRSIFDGLKKNGAKWDIIGLSAYPRWSHLDGPTMITRVMANINDLKNRYGKPCMVVETGHYPSEAVAGNQYLVGVMDEMIKNGDLGCFYWEPESMGGYDMGAWNESTKRPTVMMDAFLGVKHTEVSWLMKARLQSPASDQTLEAGNIELKTRVQHQRRGRIRSVDFYFDKQKAGTYEVENIAKVGTLITVPYEVEANEIGIHSAWAKATDNYGNTQTTDTVTFFIGESALLDNRTEESINQKGGTMNWDINLNAAGRYRLVFKYTCPGIRGTEIRLGCDSIGRTYFYKGTDSYHKYDIEVTKTGLQSLQLTATNTSGMPDISLLRIFPLDGQSIPTQYDDTGITLPGSSGSGRVFVYSLTGQLLYTASESALGISLGNKSSAVVFLPKSMGGTPNIVRKQRLK
ncbi:MAG: arabinogalactan endo-1,4-beta-galactosidase [Bacteroidaceae bacterium]|nr:arabinogalactan endo-1,4-beta-galactosidase [Bacteroidaceae bacterium]